jgi:LPXTG-motif cell wall-anchored protein
VDINIASFELNKVNEDGDTIEGAQFKLQTPSTNTLGGNTYRTEKLMKVTDENGDEYYRIATGKEVANGEATNIIEAGDVYIKGLDLDKDYQLVEVTAPDGYNKIDDPITITKCTEKEYLEKKQETDATITQKMVEEASTDKYVFEDVEVTNLTGSTLPSTGGIGTTIFYIVGGVLAVGALVLLITRKRVHLEHE